MGTEHDAVRTALGRVGAWTFAFDGMAADATASAAAEIEDLGYGALWVPEGGGSHDVLAHVSWLLTSTRRLTVASGIANITARQPEVLARGAALVADAYQGRFVLGVGVGHEYTTERRGFGWGDPLARMRDYLDAMDAATSAQPPRLLAALGDRMLQLAAERGLGAHTYFVPSEHTARAREVLGPEPVLAVEQTAVLVEDAAEARRIGRAWAVHYLELPNYARNWQRLGFRDELSGGGSDRLIDSGIAWGSADDVAARLRAHLDAGADHVCVQLIANDETDPCLDGLADVRAAMGSFTA
jgi:probable F420-dependent oxidoreductase